MVADKDNPYDIIDALIELNPFKTEEERAVEGLRKCCGLFRAVGYLVRHIDKNNITAVQWWQI